MTSTQSRPIVDLDVSQFVPFLGEPPEEFRFQPMENEYVRAVLHSMGELKETAAGFQQDTKAMIERILPLVKGRVITAENLSELPNVGFDRTDMTTVFYGRPAAESALFPVESEWLGREAWSALSVHGAISKRLDDGFVMVQAGTATNKLSRVLEGPNGMEIKPVVVRVATNDPTLVLNYRLTPKANTTAKSVASFVAELKTLIDEVDGGKELFGSRLLLFKAEIDAHLGKGLEAAGYTLTPGTVTQIEARATRAIRDGR